MKREITATFKLFSGLDKELTQPGYDPSRGVSVTMKEGTRLKAVLKILGIQKPSLNIYFLKGERIGLWKKINDGDEILCLRPSAGG